jgi:outer membrane protein assembly factor BamE (lipoprotein component of BamABCDE complex)
MHRFKPFWPLAAVLSLAVWLAGCDSERIAKLEEGLATEAQVRQQFGEPKAIFNEPDGSRTFEYPRQPAGQTNYFITIGPDGVMRSLRQVLTPANFAKVQPGMDKAGIRRLLGQPAKTQFFDLKKEEHWEWRYAEGQAAKLFVVVFDANGQVFSSASQDDPQATQAGGR